MTDRLAGLLRHYTLSAQVFHAGSFCGRHHYDGPHGYLHLIRRGPVTVQAGVHPEIRIEEPSLLLYPRVAPHRFITDPEHDADLLCAVVDLGSTAGNPLAMALPAVLQIPLVRLPSLTGTLELLFAEALGDQCGRQAAIDRLCELLLIQLLRYLMDEELAPSGLLAGLADQRLSRAIAAMHDAPREPWTLESLAACAGMSRARFAAHFREVVGLTPGQYLTDWRVNVSCTLLKAGKPVSVVADEVGYGSPTALARAFRVHMGCAPREWLATQGGG